MLCKTRKAWTVPRVLNPQRYELPPKHIESQLRLLCRVVLDVEVSRSETQLHALFPFISSLQDFAILTRQRSNLTRKKSEMLLFFSLNIVVLITSLLCETATRRTTRKNRLAEL